MSASTGASRASCRPRSSRLSCTDAPEDQAVRTRKVHVLENAARLRRGRRIEPRSHALRPDDRPVRPASRRARKSAPIKSNAQVSEANTIVSCCSPPRPECGPWPADGSRADRAPQKCGRDVTITSENAPSTRRSASAIASGRVCSRESAIRCTMTSVSLVVWKIDPCASSRDADLHAHSPGCRCAPPRSMPLFDCTRMGCALSSAESPAVE